MNNTLEVPKQSDDDDEPDKCRTLCEADIFNSYCVCPEDTSYVPDLAGLMHYCAWGFWVSTKDSAVAGGQPKLRAVIYPCMSAGPAAMGDEPAQTCPGTGIGRTMYQGYVNYNWSYKRTIKAIMLHYGWLGEFRLRGIRNDSLGYKVNVFDMTPDLDEMDGDDPPSSTKPDPDGQVPGQLIAHVPVPDPNLGPAVTARNYHEMIKNPINNSLPMQTFNFKMAGLDFRTIMPWMSPAAGLNSMNIGMDENGVFADISFSTRPPELPKQDVLMQKVGPRLNVNQFARSF